MRAESAAQVSNLGRATQLLVEQSVDAAIVDAWVEIADVRFAQESRMSMRLGISLDAAAAPSAVAVLRCLKAGEQHPAIEPALQLPKRRLHGNDGPRLVWLSRVCEQQFFVVAAPRMKNTFQRAEVSSQTRCQLSGSVNRKRQGDAARRLRICFLI